jgi:hypothetical protein
MAASFARPKAILRQALCSSFYPQLRTLFGAVGTAEKCHTGREQMQQPGMLFDHLVGAGEQRRRHREAQRPRRNQVHNQIEFRRLLDRDVARLRPA